MTIPIDKQMYEALKNAKWALDQELRGREVDDKQWEQVYAACSNAIGAYEENALREKETKASQKEKGVKFAGSRR